jgi:hypothetical protein
LDKTVAGLANGIYGLDVWSRCVPLDSPTLWH